VFFLFIRLLKKKIQKENFKCPLKYLRMFLNVKELHKNFLLIKIRKCKWDHKTWACDDNGKND